jgi:hypothetical protein
MSGVNIAKEGEIVTLIVVRAIRSWKLRKLLIQLIKLTKIQILSKDQLKAMMRLTRGNIIDVNCAEEAIG